MAGARILVVADAPGLVQTMRQTLEAKGYVVALARGGEDALVQAEASTPDLIITDVILPGMDGWSLIKRLRSTHTFAFVPVIFLASVESAESRIRGFRLGADDYLPKPIHPEELEIRVARALKQRTKIETSVRKQTTGLGRPDFPGLKGTLDQVGLPSLLTLLEMERKTGLLVVTREDADATGRCFLRDGRVVRARIDGRADISNAEAIFEVLAWTNGRFLFRPRDVEGDDEVRSPTPRLLMEATRRFDESGRHPAANVTPEGDA